MDDDMRGHSVCITLLSLLNLNSAIHNGQGGGYMCRRMADSTFNMPREIPRKPRIMCCDTQSPYNVHVPLYKLPPPPEHGRT